MPFRIIRDDMTKMQVDVIVTAANEYPDYLYGLDKTIYKAAGEEQLLMERRKIGYIKEGDVAITSAFGLPVNYIIHAVSPLFIDGFHGEFHKLRSCYAKSLQLALEYGCSSIAFPLIATGSYGFSKAKAVEIALDVIRKFLLREEMMIYLVVFGDENVKISGHLFEKIESYIESQYVIGKSSFECSDKLLEMLKLDDDFEEDDYYDYEESETYPSAPTKSSVPVFSLDSLWKRIKRSQEETFQKLLFRMIDEKKLNEVMVYKKAGKTKQFFHKIRSNVNYQPSKHTVFSFALALELSLDETKELLVSAGYAFSPGNKFDIIMQYIIEHQIYDIYKVDCILYDFGIEDYFGCEP